MLLPPNMKRQVAPPPKQPAVCVISGRPAKYRDPQTGQPYSDTGAFQAVRQLYAQAPAQPASEPIGRAQRRRKGNFLTLPFAVSSS